jgi:hypothetical protein
LQESTAQPEWLAYQPLITGLIAAAIAAVTAVVVVYLGRRLDNSRQTVTCAAALHTEVDTILRSIKNARQASPGGRTYSTVSFLANPESVTWAYRSLSQQIGALNAECARAVVDFYTTLTVLLPEAPDQPFRFDNDKLSQLESKGDDTLAKLKEVSPKMRNLVG